MFFMYRYITQLISMKFGIQWILNIASVFDGIYLAQYWPCAPHNKKLCNLYFALLIITIHCHEHQNWLESNTNSDISVREYRVVFIQFPVVSQSIAFVVKSIMHTHMTSDWSIYTLSTKEKGILSFRNEWAMGSKTGNYSKTVWNSRSRRSINTAC